MGIDNLEHGFWVNTQLSPGKKPDECPESASEETIKVMDPDGAEAAKLIALLVSHHVAVTSTLPVFEGDVPGRPPLQPRMLDAMAPQARDAYLYKRNTRFEKPPADGQTRLTHEKKM
jgi:hypothetical protein